MAIGAREFVEAAVECGLIPSDTGRSMTGTASRNLDDVLEELSLRGRIPAEALYRATRLPFRKLMLNQPLHSFEVAHPELRWLLDAPETEVSVFPHPDVFEIFVVGADAGRSLYHFGGTLSVTKPVREP